MKFYETAEANFYVDLPNKWELYCQYPEDKTWRAKPLNHVRTIKYYRDYEGARMNPEMKADAYHMKNVAWQKKRIAPWACLPIYYATGARFIKLEKAGPVGFKCAEFPLSLKELNARIKQYELDAARMERKKWFEKMLAEQCKGNKKKKRPGV